MLSHVFRPPVRAGRRLVAGRCSRVLVALAWLTTGPAAAAPLVAPAGAVIGAGADEALARLLYAHAAAEATTGPSKRRDTLAVLASVGLLTGLGERLAGPTDTRDPREFGFDPERPWRAGPDSAPDTAPPRDVESAANPTASGEATMRLRAYFQALVGAAERRRDEGGGDGTGAARVETLDPARMTLAPVLAGSDHRLVEWHPGLDETGLGGRSPVALGLTEGLHPDAAPGPDTLEVGPQRADVIAGLGSLVRLDRGGANGGNGAGAPDLTESEPITIPEFIRRILGAIFTTPWIYLALAGLVIVRLFSPGLRPVR